MPLRFGIYFHELEEHQHEAFRACIQTLRELGYQATKLSDFLNESTDKQFWISFDDNYASWHQAIPLFDELDIKATFFTNTAPLADCASDNTIRKYYDRIGFHGERTPLRSEQIRELFDLGHEIGCHGHQHLPLAQVPLEEANSDIESNLQILTEILGTKPEHFAFPFGMPRFFSSTLSEKCVQAGFRSISYATPCMHFTKYNPLSLQRSLWRLEQTPSYNIESICIDGSLMTALTGRSAIG